MSATRHAQLSQTVRRNADAFRPAWERWPHPATFRGSEMLEVIGEAGRYGKMKTLRMQGIVERVERGTWAKGAMWRFAPWVGRALEDDAE